MKFAAGLIVSRDGHQGIRLKPEPKGWYENGGTQVLNCAALRESDQSAIGMFTVQVFGTSDQMLRNTYLGSLGGHEETLGIVAECRIGDYLDEISGELQGDAASPNLTCTSEYLTQLKNRERSTDAVILRYLTAKTWWAARYERPAYAVFRYPDQLRLGCSSLREMRVIADGHLKELWAHQAEPQHDGFALIATPKLKRSGPGLMASSVSGPVFDVLGALQAPRYAASAEQLRKSYRFLNDESPDYPNSAKDAVGALESLARRITGASTLGSAIGLLQDRGKIDVPAARILEAIYAYRNRTPGVGHGGITPPSTEVAEARLIVNLCASATLYLMELDS